MKTVTGNLITMALNGEFDVIIHGCNCFHTMGAGIARAIRETLPEAYTADLRTTRGAREKVGMFSVANVVRDDVHFKVINAYTQFMTGGGEDVFEYGALAKILDDVAEQWPDARIGIPLIGCGLAGGDKERVLDIMIGSAASSRLTLVEFG